MFSLRRVAGTAALEGATLGAATAVARQLSVRVFHYLFGVWPVKSKKKRAQAAWFELKEKLEAGEPLKTPSAPSAPRETHILAHD